MPGPDTTEADNAFYVAEISDACIAIAAKDPERKLTPARVLFEVAATADAHIHKQYPGNKADGVAISAAVNFEQAVKPAAKETIDWLRAKDPITGFMYLQTVLGALNHALVDAKLPSRKFAPSAKP